MVRNNTARHRQSTSRSPAGMANRTAPPTVHRTLTAVPLEANDSYSNDPNSEEFIEHFQQHTNLSDNEYEDEDGAQVQDDGYSNADPYEDDDAGDGGEYEEGVDGNHYEDDASFERGDDEDEEESYEEMYDYDEFEEEGRRLQVDMNANPPPTTNSDEYSAHYSNNGNGDALIGQVVTAESVGGHSLAGSSSRRSQASSANRQRGGHSLAGSSRHSQASSDNRQGGGHSLAGSSSHRSQASSANRHGGHSLAGSSHHSQALSANHHGDHSLAGSSHHSQASVAGSLPSPLRPPRPRRGTDIGGGDHQSVQSSPQIGSQLRRSTRFRRGTSGRPLDNEFVSG